MSRSPAACIRRVRSGLAQAQTGPDAGFTLVEVMAAMVLFILISTTTAAILIQGLSTLRENADRVSAANIARTEIEYLRDLARRDPSIIPIGQFEGPIPPATDVKFNPDLDPNYLDPILRTSDYTITTTSNWVSFASIAHGDQSACDAESATPAYLRVVVTVSSPTLAKPASVQTNITQQQQGPAVADGSTTGAIAIQVVNDVSVPVSDVAVSFADEFHPTNAKPTLTTGFDGCLYIPGLTPTASLVATISRPGFVSSTPTGTTKTLAVAVGEVTKVTFEYAEGATLRFASSDADFAFPAGVEANWKVKGTGGSVQVNAMTDAITGLWPGDDVEAWAGSCPDADPLYLGSARPAFSLEAGGTTVARLPVTPVKVKGLLPDEPAKAHHVGSCESVLDLGQAPKTGPILLGMPYGDWTFKAAGETVPLTTPLVPPAPGAAPELVVVKFVQDEIKATPSPTPTPSPTGTASPSPEPTDSITPTPEPTDTGPVGNPIGP